VIKVKYCLHVVVVATLVHVYFGGEVHRKVVKRALEVQTAIPFAQRTWQKSKVTRKSILDREG